MIFIANVGLVTELDYIVNCDSENYWYFKLQAILSYICYFPAKMLFAQSNENTCCTASVGSFWNSATGSLGTFCTLASSLNFKYDLLKFNKFKLSLSAGH